MRDEERREGLSETLLTAMREAARTASVGKDEIQVLAVADEHSITEKYQVSHAQVQRVAMEAEILPARYMRNFGTMGFEGQLALLNGYVGLVGAGGLGGTVVELLTRMGVGKLVVVDFDRFEDNNLNRQLLATEKNLGQSKIEAARERAGELNRAVEIAGVAEKFTTENGETIFGGCQILVDALDNMSSRFLLQKLAREVLGVPLVHAAIGGFTGQVTTIFPEDRGLETIYGPIYEKWQAAQQGQKVPGKDEGKAEGTGENEREGKDEGESEAGSFADSNSDKLAEVALGNPAGTPTLTAAWQVQEVVKYLTGQGELLRHKLLYLDAFSGMVEEITY